MNLCRGMAVLVVVALLQGATLAQEQPIGWSSTNVTQNAGLIAKVQPEALTEVERLRWELANTREQLHAAMVERDTCRAQITPVRAEVLTSERAKLKADIELAHDCATKGCSFDTQTGRLTKKPETPKER